MKIRTNLLHGSGAVLCKERQHPLQDKFRLFFRHEMATLGYAGAFDIAGQRFPFFHYVPEFADYAVLSPQKQQRRFNLLFAVRFIQLHVNRSAGAVIFADAVDGTDVAETAGVLGQYVRWEIGPGGRSDLQIQIVVDKPFR